jgi:hypothetical protein
MAGFVGEDTAKDEKAVLDLVSALSAEEFGAFMLFAREIVRAALVSPRIVVRDDGDETPLKDDEVAPDDIPELDFWAIFRWATAQDRAVKVDKGEVSVDALGNFPSDAGVSVAGEDGGEVSHKAIESPENP